MNRCAARFALIAILLVPWELPLALERAMQRGPVSAFVRLSPETLRIGDTVLLELEVRAAAGVEVFMPAFGESLERFEVLDFVPEERVDDVGNTISAQRYRLYASASGTHTIPPLIIEFVDRRPGERTAPEDEDAYELLTEAVEFTVESVVPSGASDQLKPLPGELLEQSVRPTMHWGWFAGLIALLAAAVPLGWRWWRQFSARAKQRSAYEIAVARLDVLGEGPPPSGASLAAIDAFFVELSDIVRHYLEDRFSLHAPELTTEEFLDIASHSPDLTLAHHRFLNEFLRTADQVKFAHQVPDPAYLETAVVGVRGFLEQTQAVAGERGTQPPNPAHAAA